MTTAALMHPPLRRNADFRRLLLGLAASQAGDWLYNVALAAIVWQRTGSAAWVGATTAARVVPIVLLGPIGGMIADRFDRRRSMIVSDVVRAGLMLALAAVVVLQAPIVLVPLLAAAATAAGSAFPTCASAVVRVL